MFSLLKAFAMILFDQIAAAVLLVSLTVCLQCAGTVALIEWLKRVLAKNIYKHGPGYAATLVVKSTLAIVILQGLAHSSLGQFLPDALLPVMGACLLLLRDQLFHCGIW